MENLLRYIKANARCSFTIWEKHEAAAVLMGAGIAAVLAVLTLHGFEIVFNTKVEQYYFPVFVFLWFVAIVLLVTPYRMWRESYEIISEYQKRMRPILGASYDDSSPACHKEVFLSADGGKTGTKGHSIRLMIECLSDVPVQQCVGWLTMIEFEQKPGEFNEIPIYEPNRLHWATKSNEFAPINIHQNVPNFLGICNSRDGWKHFNYRSGVQSFVAPHDFSDLGNYRFTVRVVAENSATVTVPILITWNGKWDEMKICLEENS